MWRMVEGNWGLLRGSAWLLVVGLSLSCASQSPKTEAPAGQAPEQVSTEGQKPKTRQAPHPPKAPSEPVSNAPEGGDDTAQQPSQVDPTRLSPGYGTDSPSQFVAADPRQRWMVLCQARQDTDGNGVIASGFGLHGWPRGDEMRPYFVKGGGAGVPADEYLGSDPSGRYVALRHGTEIVLEDVETGQSSKLSANAVDTRPDPSAAMPTRQVSFGAQGKHLLMIGDARGAQAKLLLRELSTGKTRKLSAGRGLVWQASLSVREKWAKVLVVTRDTNKNGKLDLPVVGTTLSGAVCRGSGTFSTFGVRAGNDAYETRYLHLASGRIMRGDGVILTYGDELLRRTAKGRIEAVSATGRVRWRLPEHCTGKVLRANSKRDAVLAACNPEPGRRSGPETWLFRGGVGTGLGYSSTTSMDTREESLDDFYSRGAYGVFDLAVGVRLQLPRNTRFCAARGNHILVRSEDDTTLLWEPAIDRTRVVSKNPCYDSGLRNGDLVLLGGELFDFKELRVVGHFPSYVDRFQFGTRYARGLSALGQALLEPHYDLARRLPGAKPAATGQFHWLAPVAVAQSTSP